MRKIYLEEDSGCDGYYQIVAVPNGDAFDFHAIAGSETEIEEFRAVKGAMILPNIAYHRCEDDLEEDFLLEVEDFKGPRTPEDLEAKGFLKLEGLEVEYYLDCEE